MPQLEEPTEAQIKEFWEWCELQGLKPLSDDGRVLFGLNSKKQLAIVRVDLNNLFKYAVPKVKDIIQHKRVDPVNSYQYQLFLFLQGWVTSISHGNEDPALTLFWAIWEVMKDELHRVV